MATIKDIAEAAGVSRGTVSNVLNGRDIVSSEKIQKVMKVVEEMGYSINEKAQNLRKGSAKLLAVVLPNIEDHLYTDFYTSFNLIAEKEGYVTDLYISNDNPDYERSLIARMKSRLTQGVATFSAISDGSEAYYDVGFSKEDVLFVSRRQMYESQFLGFDMKKIGIDLADYVKKRSPQRVAFVTGAMHCESRKRLCESFIGHMNEVQPNSNVRVYSTTRECRYQEINRIFSKGIPEIVIAENTGLANIVKNIWQDFYKEGKIEIITISTVCPIPVDEYVRYEMDYRALGERAAKRLIQRKKTMEPVEILQAKGFAHWCQKDKEMQGTTINVLSVGSPTTQALKTIAKYYYEISGNRVVLTELSIDSLYELLKNWSSGLAFDIVRMDKEWFPWMAEKIFEPLKNIDSNIEECMKGFLSNTLKEYAYVNDELYAFPGSPSVQLLFYRKDLFEDPILKRLFFEKYKKPLKIPENFEDYNQIASFFTKAVNHQSPVKYGCTFTGGKNRVAGVEFLMRYYSHTKSLWFEENSKSNKILKMTLKETIDSWKYSSKKEHVWWNDSVREFADGETAMTIQFANHATGFFKEDSKVIGKLGWAMVPGGNPILGGSVSGISKYSENKLAAIDFLEWLNRNDINTALTLFGGMPTQEAVYESSEIKTTYPWMRFAKKCFESAEKDIPEIEIKTFVSHIGATLRTELRKSCPGKDEEEFLHKILENNEM